MLRASRRWFVVLLLALPVRPALAWDPESHVSIVRGAMVLSPAAEARIPVEFRDEMFREVGHADLADKICAAHRGPQAAKDPAREAERLLGSMRKPGASAYYKTQMLGQYLHYVADCVVPAPLASGRLNRLSDFWANRDFLIYREARRLREPLAEALRMEDSRAASLGGGADSPSALFRQAVNVTVDALLHVPARAEPAAQAAAEAGPVIFMVNRADTGLSGVRLSAYEVTVWQASANTVFETSYLIGVRSGGRGGGGRDLLNRIGVQVAEAVMRNEASGPTAHLLLLNNQPQPACGIQIEGNPGFAHPLEATLPANSLTPIAFPLPSGIRVEDLSVAFRTGCPEGKVSASSFPIFPRFVVGGGIRAPRFDTSGTVTLGAPPPGGRVSALSAKAAQRPDASRPAGAFSVASQDAQNAGPGVEVRISRQAATELLGRLSLTAFRLSADGKSWAGDVTVRTDDSWIPRKTSLEIEAVDSGGDSAGREVLWIDTATLKPSATNTFRIAPTRLPAWARGFRLLHVEFSAPSTPAPTAQVPPVTNRIPR